MASVVPSPEVVVERSVVAGSVVEGGAGDVVVAGSRSPAPWSRAARNISAVTAGSGWAATRSPSGDTTRARGTGTAWPKKKKETHAGPSAVGIAAPVVPVGIALALVEMAVAPAWKNVAPACAASDFIYSFIQVINHLCSRSTVRTTATASRPKTRPQVASGAPRRQAPDLEDQVDEAHPLFACAFARAD